MRIRELCANMANSNYANYKKTLFLFQFHFYALHRAFRGAEAAAFAVIVIGIRFFLFAVGVDHRDAGFRADLGAGAAADAFIEVRLGDEGPPAAGFVLYCRAGQ